MTDREALADLLEAIDLAIYSGDWKVDGACDPDAAIQRARDILAQPEQEPVARVVEAYATKAPTIQAIAGREHQLRVGDFLYTTPPQRTWVGLTDEDAHELWESTDLGDDWELMKRTEAKLKEKNT